MNRLDQGNSGFSLFPEFRNALSVEALENILTPDHKDAQAPELAPSGVKQLDALAVCLNWREPSILDAKLDQAMRSRFRLDEQNPQSRLRLMLVDAWRDANLLAKTHWTWLENLAELAGFARQLETALNSWKGDEALLFKRPFSAEAWRKTGIFSRIERMLRAGRGMDGENNNVNGNDIFESLAGLARFQEEVSDYAHKFTGGRKFSLARFYFLVRLAELFAICTYEKLEFQSTKEFGDANWNCLVHEAFRLAGLGVSGLSGLMRELTRVKQPQIALNAPGDPTGKLSAPQTHNSVPNAQIYTLRVKDSLIFLSSEISNNTGPVLGLADLPSSDIKQFIMPDPASSDLFPQPS